MSYELTEREVAGPVPALVLAGSPLPTEYGERPPAGVVVLTRADALRLADDLAELVDRWR